MQMAHETDAITDASACYKVKHCDIIGGGINIANTGAKM